MQQQLFAQRHQWQSAGVDWSQRQQGSRPIRQSIEAALQRAVDLGCVRGEQAPWAKMARTCDQLLQRFNGLWTFLEVHGVEHTNNAAEREACAGR